MILFRKGQLLSKFMVAGFVVLCGQQGYSKTLENGMPVLSSNPGAAAVIYLDFDGGKGFGHQLRPHGGDSVFDRDERAEIEKVWKEVSVMFSMFDLDVTTVAPAVKKIPAVHVIISPDVPSPGAISSHDLLDRGHLNDSRCIVRSSSVVGGFVPSLCHEIGHALDLNHQALFNSKGHRTTSYRPADEWGRAFLMGSANDSSAKFSHWGDGYVLKNGVRTAEDGMKKIAATIVKHAEDYTNGSYQGDGYRKDDHAEARGKGTKITLKTSGRMKGRGSSEGIIERYSDRDWFQFDWPGGEVEVTVEAKKSIGSPQPYASSVGTKVALVDFGTTFFVNNGPSDPSDVDSSVSKNLPAGTYYVRVQSGGGQDDLGAYTVKVGGTPFKVGGHIDVEGFAMADAIGAINDAEHQLGYILYEASKTVKDGHVIEQTQTSGTIDLVVSVGDDPRFR